MGTIQAIYENGVFRPVVPVDLPEHSQVEFVPRVVAPPAPDNLDDIYEVLSRRYDTGIEDLAERHNEHQS